MSSMASPQFSWTKIVVPLCGALILSALLAGSSLSTLFAPVAVSSINTAASLAGVVPQRQSVSVGTQTRPGPEKFTYLPAARVSSDFVTTTPFPLIGLVVGVSAIFGAVAVKFWNQSSQALAAYSGSGVSPLALSGPSTTDARAPRGERMVLRAAKGAKGGKGGGGGKIAGYIKLALPAGKATPAPPVGPALGQYGLNIVAFCKEYNAATEKEAGNDMIIPVEITAFADRSFTFVLKTPPASVLLRKAAGVPRGSATSNSVKVGSVTAAQLEEIAKIKLPDLNTNDVEQAKKIIAGTAKNMGITVA